jgi:hypothetical protein
LDELSSGEMVQRLIPEWVLEIAQCECLTQERDGRVKRASIVRVGLSARKENMSAAFKELAWICHEVRVRAINLCQDEVGRELGVSFWQRRGRIRNWVVSEFSIPP